VFEPAPPRPPLSQIGRRGLSYQPLSHSSGRACPRGGGAHRDQKTVRRGAFSAGQIQATWRECTLPAGCLSTPSSAYYVPSSFGRRQTRGWLAQLPSRHAAGGFVARSDCASVDSRRNIGTLAIFVRRASGPAKNVYETGGPTAGGFARRSRPGVGGGHTRPPAGDAGGLKIVQRCRNGYCARVRWPQPLHRQRLQHWKKPIASFSVPARLLSIPTYQTAEPWASTYSH